jgi:hypothetical protein
MESPAAALLLTRDGPSLVGDVKRGDLADGFPDKSSQDIAVGDFDLIGSKYSGC